MTKEGTLLIVDDNRGILEALQLLLGKYFARVLTLPSPNRLDAILRDEQIDVVLLDMNFTAGINTGNEGIFWLREILVRQPDIKVVLFTAYADIDLAVKAIRDGAVDFVVKPWDNEKLVASLRNAYNLAQTERKIKQLKEIRHELTTEEPMFWGASSAMARIREIVGKVAATDANILITGENGTGKEILAREIHNRSPRSGELMVGVDMGLCLKHSSKANYSATSKEPSRTHEPTAPGNSRSRTRELSFSTRSATSQSTYSRNY